MSNDFPCPCGFGNTYADCCRPLHHGAAAPTAAQLMRSRYSAFALGLADYLAHSWHSSTRPDKIALDSDTQWLRLIVEGSEAGGPFDTTGTVTFTAIGREDGARFELRECSRFVREAGRWVYLDGDVTS